MAEWEFLHRRFHPVVLLTGFDMSAAYVILWIAESWSRLILRPNRTSPGFLFGINLTLLRSTVLLAVWSCFLTRGSTFFANTIAFFCYQSCACVNPLLRRSMHECAQQLRHPLKKPLFCAALTCPDLPWPALQFKNLLLASRSHPELDTRNTCFAGCWGGLVGLLRRLGQRNHPSEAEPRHGQEELVRAVRHCYGNHESKI